MAPHDETASRERITQILLQTRWDGWRSLFGVLEHQEPALAAYALAMANLLAEKLENSGVPVSLVKCVHREMITAELVCIESMRQASRELWKDFLPDAEPEEAGMKFKVGDVVKVCYAPRKCVTNWPSMVGHVGFVEELLFNGTRALVRTITIDGAMHRLAFIDVWALERVDDPAWAEAAAKYKQEGANMNEPKSKPINPFDAARRSSGIQVGIDLHDVLAFRPHAGEAWARTFLEIHKEPIARAMLVAGTAFIRDLLEQSHGN